MILSKCSSVELVVTVIFDVVIPLIKEKICNWLLIALDTESLK